MTLNDLKTGESAVITRIRGRGAFRKRITEMGFVSGQPVTVIRSAPLKDPVEYRIMSGNVSLRRSEATQIEVASLGIDAQTSPVHVFQPLENGSAQTLRAVQPDKQVKVALVGNPNSGKTTIFNRVSRSREHVGNYSGVTVGSKMASFHYRGYGFEFTDLPGTYSLSAYSQEEVIVRKHIMNEQPDVVVNVVDANNLDRNLYLTTQLIDMGIQVVLALNMYDELEVRGDAIDFEQLGRMIGIPIIPTIGKRGKGIHRLLNKIIGVLEEREPAAERHTQINYGLEMEQSIDRVQKIIEDELDRFRHYSTRYLAIKLLEKDEHCISILAAVPGYETIQETVSHEINRLKSLYQEDTETIITNARYAFISGALRETRKKGDRDPVLTRTQKIDRILTHKYLGFPIFMLFLYIMFQATFSLGNYPMEWIGMGIDTMSAGLNQLLPAGIVRDLLVDGVIGGVGGVIVFLPNILILFFFISLMEDTGYMARTAFIMDKVMHLFGLHGKSFIPLIMGFGCNVPAIMATRTLENKQDRILTMLIIPFMSCSARLPVYVLIAGAVFPGHAGNVIFGLYLVGVVVSLLMAIILKKTLFKNKEAPFVMELPIYRSPGIRMILRHMWMKGMHYLRKMGGVILVASIIIWALGYFPRQVDYSKDYEALIQTEELHLNYLESYEEQIDQSYMEEQMEESRERITSLNVQKRTEHQEQSFIGRIGKTIEPVIQPLGFDWKMGISLVTGFAAKEVVVSTMGVLYQETEQGESTVSLQEKIRSQEYHTGPRSGQKVYTPLAGISFLLFVLLYLPCIAVVVAVGREAGHWKWSALVLFYTTAIAWTVSFCVYQIGSLF